MNKIRNYLIGMLVLVLLLASGYFYFSKLAPDRQTGLAGQNLARVIEQLRTAITKPPGLMLSPQREQEIRTNGTWADLFPPSAIQNRSQAVAVLFWWGFLLALGWLVFPLVRVALPGLGDGGYPFARLAGLLLLSYPTWLAGSLGVPVTRSTIAWVLGGLSLFSLGVFIVDRKPFLGLIRESRGYILKIELLALGAFFVFLLVRLGNPDLWHVIFGGEKPMDFSYFNAVLKSPTYPPYDPWFAGGVMNYYYYGFVLVGLPVKLLGITPSVAYNLILPTLFSLVILGAFSIGWNLHRSHTWLAGIFSALGLTVLGNLGDVRMVWQGWQRLAAEQGMIDAASAWQRFQLAVSGAVRWLAGAQLPYSTGDWYWIPSRAVIPAHNAEITEFPLFSFIYADPHAHLIALPVTLLVIAWSLSALFCSGRWGRWPRTLWGLAFGALVAGTLRAANSWDHPTYLLFATLALGVAMVPGFRENWQRRDWFKLVEGPVRLLLFVGFSFLFFVPFNAAFWQSYTQVLPWHGDHVDLVSYLTHWGLFVFVLASWLFDEIIDWMAHTPLSGLERFKPYRGLFFGIILLVLAAFYGLVNQGIAAAWVVVPLGMGCLLLLLRRDQTMPKRFALFMAGTGLALTLTVELIALQGDRMNTIFKLYFQAWTFLSISSAAGLGWLMPKLNGWRPLVKNGFRLVLLAMVAGCAFTTLSSTEHKIIDRMAEHAPHTLDGMAFLDYASMLDGQPGTEGGVIQMANDADAIRWVQQNVPGSPVIVEAHTGEYRHWGTRFTIYTGLPAVIGWEAHEHQQRDMIPGNPIAERVQQVADFYITQDRDQATAFLEQYQVEYIVLGQLERLYYPGGGLEKFPALCGDLWDRVYSNGDTEIYRVRLKVNFP